MKNDKVSVMEQRVGVGRHGSIGKPVEKPRNFLGTSNRLFKYFSPDKYQLLIIVIFAVVAALISASGPKILGMATTQLFDDISKSWSVQQQDLTTVQVEGAGQDSVAGLASLPSINFEAIGKILLVLLGAYVLSSLLTFIQQYILASVTQRTIYRLRRDVNLKLNRLPLHFFDTKTHGEILSRVVNDLDNVGSTLQQSLFQFITSAFTVLGITIMMVWMSPVLTLVVFGTLPFSSLLMAQIAKRSQKYFRDQQRINGELVGHIEEVYSGHLEVKAFGQENRVSAKFLKLNDQLYETGWKAQFASGIIMPLMRLIGNIGYIVVAVVGSLMVSRGRLAIGEIQAFIQYANQFQHPIAQLANVVNVIQSMMASAERVFEILDEEEEVAEVKRSVKLNDVKGQVEFDKVDFGFDPDKYLLQQISFQVKPGEMVAIVGHTGAGKTTLINLLMRFYELNGGRILLDGVDITHLSRGKLRRNFGMVLQNTWLFHGSIEANIAYGKTGATKLEVLRAAKAALADRFIQTLPNGYNFILNEDVSNISQGQKQLITIARAFLANPPILILDEATSSVDTRTEALIQLAMRKLLKNRTSFVIAHRLSTIRHADQILVMSKGKIVEQGNHDQLLSHQGVYAKLYQSQFANPNSSIDEVMELEGLDNT